MDQAVLIRPAPEGEVLAFERDVRKALLAIAKLLSDYGPLLRRPHVDMLEG